MGSESIFYIEIKFALFNLSPLPSSLTFHHSSLTPPSSLTPHNSSPITPNSSLTLITHHSPLILIIYPSSLITHPFITHPSSLITHYSPLITHPSSLITQSSLKSCNLKGNSIFFPRFFLHILACYFNIIMITICLCWMVFPSGARTWILSVGVWFFLISLAASRIRIQLQIYGCWIPCWLTSSESGSPA